MPSEMHVARGKQERRDLSAVLLKLLMGRHVSDVAGRFCIDEWEKPDAPPRSASRLSQ